MPGLIVMELRDLHGAVDPSWARVVVVFNAGNQATTFTVPGLMGQPLQLHPVQQASGDPEVRKADFDRRAGALRVPARTTAVFVQPR